MPALYRRCWTCSICEREFTGDKHICWPTPRAIINTLKDWWRNRNYKHQEGSSASKDHEG